MYTKSLIQQKADQMQLFESFKNSLVSLTDKYNVTDAVFGISNKKCVEWTSGYFVEEAEFATLKDAINEMKSERQGIRIVNNEKYILGSFYGTLVECDDCDKIFDIEFLEYIK